MVGRAEGREFLEGPGRNCPGLPGSGLCLGDARAETPGAQEERGSGILRSWGAQIGDGSPHLRGRSTCSEPGALGSAARVEMYGREWASARVRAGKGVWQPVLGLCRKTDVGVGGRQKRFCLVSSQRSSVCLEAKLLSECQT